MAFDYTTANTGVFYRLGRPVKAVNAHLVEAVTTLPAELSTIWTPHQAAGITYEAIITGLIATYDGFKSQVVALRQALAGYADRILLDRDTVLVPLGLLSGNTRDVLSALITQMGVDAQTVKRSTVTLGAITAVAGNTGNGTALLTKVLDGYNQPIQGALAHLKYNGLDSELAVPSETMILACTADSVRDGTQEGAERFTWTGGIKNPDLDYRAEGSGQGPAITVVGASRLVIDGGFESWGGTGNNTPSSWTIDSGTAGTHVFRESTNIYLGTYSAKLLGDGATATIGLGQALTVQSLKPRRRYNLSFRVLASGVPAVGTLTVKLTGTGYTATASELVVVAAASFPVAWSLQNFWINLPSILPSDLRVVIQLTGPLSNGTAVYIDNLSVAEVVYHGGVGLVLVSGATRWIAGDVLTFTVANDAAGVFQEFMRKKYQVQLPSAGSPTISDGLAT